MCTASIKRARAFSWVWSKCFDRKLPVGKVAGGIYIGVSNTFILQVAVFYMDLIFIAAAWVIGLVAGSNIHKIKARIRPDKSEKPKDAEVSEKTEDKDEPGSTEKSIPENIAELYKLASDMEDYFDNTAHPKDLLESDDFKKGVEFFRAAEFTNDELYGYCTGENVTISCMAFEALNQRDGSTDYIEPIIANLKKTYLWPMFFALHIVEQSSSDVVGRTLANARKWWGDYKVLVQIFDNFIQARISKGENPCFGESLSELTGENILHITRFVEQLKTSSIESLVEELGQKKSTLLDSIYLNTVGHVWSDDNQGSIVVRHDYLNECLRQLEEALFKPPGRSALLVGEPGVGKSAILKALVDKDELKEWKIFEASATDILAGQVYIGELEERIQKLIENLDSKRGVIWYIPDFHQLHYAGKHRYSPTSVLDMILPFIENGKIKVIGETHPSSNEKLSSDNKRIHSALEVISIQPLEDHATLKLARDWLEESKTSQESFEMDSSALTEALHLSQQFLNDTEAPGNLLNFVKIAKRQLLIEGKSDTRISTDDLYAALSQLTGLPRSILDDQAGLNLDDLRQLFNQRVLGQPEAVECLVERVAMIKAGLSDPTRPFGVFLFAGPTGTGKTEIAKALALFLFGSADRMIRLDMSEFKTAESVDRILGESREEVNTTALVNQIRKQPFSVILLDEFEKAHSNVWDLFLQVFDDGRLTDKKGNTSDFRHTIIIMTSNLGATIKMGANIGFNPSDNGFSLSVVEKTIFKTFRREFVNRIDRIVVFHPLSRAIMRRILYNELNNILQRRGLRNREWAVEWEDSAIDFLLEKGFTPDLGARPLKRAIERYLLSPLALTIVNHQFPEGDQFLFVRSDNRQIQVEFIDPDATDLETRSIPKPGTTSRNDGQDLTLKQIILEPQGTEAEMAYLNNRYQQLQAAIQNETWQALKDGYFDAMAAAGFWESPNRFKILSAAEYMDRIESGLSTAESLVNRTSRSAVPLTLRTRVAQQLYLLNEAYENLNTKSPKDAFLKITSGPGSDSEMQAMNEFAHKLKNMYVSWARQRHMKLDTLLESREEDPQKYTSILAISGFGAYSILAPENGVHVLEFPRKDKKFIKLNVKIEVAPQPDMPANNLRDLLVQAQDAFKQAEPPKTIVRRYREAPSPLVRDSVRKWRTGRLDRVFEGNFDLYA